MKGGVPGQSYKLVKKREVCFLRKNPRGEKKVHASQAKRQGVFNPKNQVSRGSKYLQGCQGGCHKTRRMGAISARYRKEGKQKVKGGVMSKHVGGKRN